MRTRGWTSVVAVLMLLVSLSFKAQAQGAAVADIALYRGADRQAKLEAGAKQEKEVVWYTSMSQNDSSQLVRLFENRYASIKINLIRLTSERILQRYTAEAQAGQFFADLLDTNDSDLEYLRRKGMLRPFATPSTEHYDKRFVQPQGYWAASRITMIVLGYNTRLVKRTEAPKRYEDLLDPKWKGMIALEQNQTDWFMTLMEHWGEERGKAFFQRLRGQNPQMRTGHNLMAQLIAAGEDSLSPNAYSHHMASDQRKGAPVDWVNIEPVIGGLRVAGMAKNTPHPHAALLFLDLVHSKDGQKVVQEASRIPTHPEVLPNPPRLREGFQFIMVDPVKYLEKIDHYSKLWRDWMLK